MGPVVRGRCSTLSAQEQSLREHIQQRSFNKICADKVLASAENLVAWPTRSQFVEALADRCDKVR